MKKIFLIILTLAVMMISCDEVNTNERLIYVEPPQVSRAVLIEDFTGQYCVNCPRATEEIERLVEEYGDTIVVAVAIHSGPFSKKKDEPSPLFTPTGDEYFSHWNLSSQPIGLIDRLFSSTPFDYTDWGAGVNYELNKHAPVSISMTSTLDEDNSTGMVSVQVIGLDSALVKGKLQVWLVEDSIDSFQYLPDGSIQEHYNHMHVFRATLNGMWGDDVSVSHGEVVVKDYDLVLETSWVPAHCAIVAFLYDEVGVQQVSKKKLR